MKHSIWIALFLLPLALSTATANDERPDQQGVLVFERNCFDIEDNTARLEYPMLNGEPDSKNGRLVGQKIKLVLNPKTGKPICLGHYEVRKIK